jgi:hypothetical protein
MDRAEVESFQLRSAQRRFEELAPKVRLLKRQVDAGITAIRTLQHLVPLLFKDAVYKSCRPQKYRSRESSRERVFMMQPTKD